MPPQRPAREKQPGLYDRQQIHVHRFGNEHDVCTCCSTIMLAFNHVHHSLKHHLGNLPPVVPSLKFPELNKPRKTVKLITESILVFQRPIEIVYLSPNDEVKVEVKCLSKWEWWTVSHLTNTVCLEAKSLKPAWNCRDEWRTPKQACSSNIPAPPCLELPQRLTAEKKVSVLHQLYTQDYGISQICPKHQMYLFKGTKICKHMWWSKLCVGALRINSILKFE